MFINLYFLRFPYDYINGNVADVDVTISVIVYKKTFSYLERRLNLVL